MLVVKNNICHRSCVSVQRFGEVTVRVFFLILALFAQSFAQAKEIRPPAAIIADPPVNAAYPPRLVQARYGTGGVNVPARFFIAAGAGRHPTVLLLHGFPGTELNLDLARAIQRVGWNVLAIHYRGVWGAPGQFALGNTVEDARSALTWLREPDRKSLVDTSRIVVLGHSMGGFDTVMIGDDAEVAGFVTLSAWDVSAEAARLNTPAGRAAAETELAEDLSFTNMTFASMADEIATNTKAWNWESNAAEMAGRPILVIDSDDGLAPRGDAVVAAVNAAGGPTPTRLKFETDHSYNDHRIALTSAVVAWLQAEFP